MKNLTLIAALLAALLIGATPAQAAKAGTSESCGKTFCPLPWKQPRVETLNERAAKFAHNHCKTVFTPSSPAYDQCVNATKQQYLQRAK